MDRFSKVTKKKYFIPITLTFTVTFTVVLALFFQNCGKGGFHTLNMGPLDSLHDHSGHIHDQPSQSVGRDPNFSTAGVVYYGLFQKIPRANGIVPEGQLGKAMLLQTDEATYVSAAAVGLQPNQNYMAHVHVDSCANGAGGHFKKDSTITEVIESNEIWLRFATDADGFGHARAQVPYVAGPSAKSLVIHNLDNSKYYCADFVSHAIPVQSSSWYNGQFAPRPTTKVGVNIQGNATKVVLPNGMSGFRIVVWGLTPGKTYNSHVHLLSCSAGAGGHFLIDSAGAPAAANEVTFQLNGGTTGVATGEVWISQVTQTTANSALSIIIHDPDDGSQQACADLVSYGSSGPIGGKFQLMDGSASRKLILASATDKTPGVGFEFPRNLSAAPSVNLGGTVAGLPPGNYVGHVHNRPCRKGAGGHYFIDQGFGKVEESNEVWLRVTVGADGAGIINSTAPVVLRADAMSVVLHDFTDSSKLLCADLL